LAEYAADCSLLLTDEYFGTHLDIKCASDRLRASLSDQPKRHSAS
jgi:hypothetical protein